MGSRTRVRPEQGPLLELRGSVIRLEVEPEQGPLLGKSSEMGSGTRGVTDAGTRSAPRVEATPHTRGWGRNKVL
jgi:hypothetical protein